MTVIKQQQIDGGGHRLDPVEIEDFDRRAEAIVEEARMAAAAIIESARSQANDLMESKRREGFEVGRQEGVRQGADEGRAEAVTSHGDQFRELATAWQERLSQWQEERDAMFRSAQHDVVKLAVMLSGQIVHRAVRIDSGVIRAQLESAMALVRSRSDLVIVISPDDEPLVAEVLEDLLGSFSNCRDATIRVEPGLAPGGCRLELDGGVIDASLEAQLHRMTELMLPDEPVQQVSDVQGA